MRSTSSFPSAHRRAKGHPLQMRATAAAFTLIELLVVIGVIAILAGAMGMGLSGGNQATDLASAREILRVQLIAARSQAALHQHEAALFIAADPSDDTHYLRYLTVVARETASSPWRISSRGATLPGEVWVMPPVSGSTVLTGTASIEVTPGQPATLGYLLPINANGTLTNGGAGELWVSIGTLEGNQVRFDQSSPRLGITLSRYGAISLIDDDGGGAP